MLFTLDIRRDAIEPESLRNFVGRYLNAGRLPDLLGTGPEPDDPPAIVPNACLTCPDLRRCHETFGASEDRYGFYPFNGAAIDRLIDLASPGDFQPREILREVIRAPLEVAEEELPSGGFPFRRSSPGPWTTCAKPVPPGVRATIRRLNHVRPGSGTEPARLLRPLAARGGPGPGGIARYLGARLTPGVTDDPEPRPGRRPDAPTGPTGPSADEIDQWANGEGGFPPRHGAPHPAVDLRRGSRSPAVGPVRPRHQPQVQAHRDRVADRLLHTARHRRRYRTGRGRRSRGPPASLPHHRHGRERRHDPGHPRSSQREQPGLRRPGSVVLQPPDQDQRLRRQHRPPRGRRHRGGPPRGHARPGDPALYGGGPGPLGPRCPGGHAGARPAAAERDHQGIPPRGAAHPR